ncbi:hypothetical protein A3F07_00760 [candidate division WWE3 bacterium RIFCSPHIGHO2_12_FULL_38_15]|uniref:Glycosyltransferase RgtA/B/C/D-like domain-containing protein n=1 Tax=candidate division WWE3 bacterium RIFCSPHIGHO2_02_FULL_38_14 TaxID=1802620 RepID=A0A1F4VBC6_UNCKA|nr:MAG: hypothetical protein A2793_00845 [candidate division WWE3 bacterium RIFCSPHIGHO2_01_FULL_38_45]OGC49105.1 MAG: hypothetical protein A3F07_00760 [candidate division WWE3 bacterium RIFCSPHIGHO2_12_FULL_38_15]OGC53560.1 MAG: hypothetical protein A3B64_04395 [candidate division WWE3 bacterium RIFCSPLOWO2_01_FULL_37_24]OGC54464.1 MAG: hypothetical protein A3D91_01025 [candidate division WWE3 bacterium RIFCSPHIGHO2_02_FULL_38_14]HLB51710.1 hypothetical protein [Patescibacteria group bacterium
MRNLFFLSIVSFIALHIFLINFNYAEWGDTYRILRASEFIRNLSYPEDEKRPPLFSAVLAVRPENVDQIFWGRVVMFFMSISAFIVFFKLTEIYLKSDFEKVLAVILFILNPVYLYWSIRIYADVPFSILCMLALLLYSKWRLTLNLAKVFILSLVASMAILTRFEGFILFAALGVALLFNGRFQFKIPDLSSLNLKQFFMYSFTTMILTMPYLVVKNPLDSKYLEETAGRSYDLKMVAIFMLSFLFVLGLNMAVYFFVRSKRNLFGFLKENIHIFAFLILEMLLILVWPAAIPRLFVPLIPVFIILFSKAINDYYTSDERAPKLIFFSLTILLLIIHLAGQYTFRLQFLVNIKYLLTATILLQLAVSAVLYFKKKYIFLMVLVISLSVWSLGVLYVHKDIYRSIKEASIYAAENFEGNVGYNDVSSISDWYLNYYDGGKNNTGTYLYYSKKADLNYENLTKKKLSYLLMTNEHNTDTTLDIEQRPYLKQLKEFNYIINNKEFWTKVLEIKENE